MNDNPKCPRCMSGMVIRTARTGKNAGNQFWGCSKYPSCKGTRDLQYPSSVEMGTNASSRPNPPGPSEECLTDANAEEAIPRPLFSARERRQGFDVQFRQGIAVPFTQLPTINQSEELRQEYLRIGHWRLDHTRPSYLVHPDLRMVTGLLRKLMKRGRLTILTHALEDQLRVLFVKKDEDTPRVGSDFMPSHLIEAIEDPRQLDVWMDGTGPESKFYWDIARNSMGFGFHRYIVPQAVRSDLASTSIDEPGDSSRIDFLVSFDDSCIAVEIDDAKHLAHIERDRNRDELLRMRNIQTIRIPVAEIEESQGPNYDLFLEACNSRKGASKSFGMDDTIQNSLSYDLAVKLAFQIEVAIIEALDLGLLDMETPTVGVNINSRVFKPTVIKAFLKRIEEDLREQLSMTFLLHNLTAPDSLASLRVVPSAEMKQGLLVTYQTDVKPTGPCMIIQDVLLPFCYADPVPPMLPVERSEVDAEVLKYYLRFLFRKPDFLEGQLETIQRVLCGKDTIVLLPTGAGKSIAFQLAAFLLPGVAIAVDPIISLIHDQIDNLRRVGIDRVGSVSSDNRLQEEKRAAVARFGQGEYLLFYISPERFQMVDFRNALREASMTRPIPLVAIDEAHCVSEWGHDFRTAYLNLGRIIRDFCRNGMKPACIAALTGTASSSVLHDVQRELQIMGYDAIITPKSFDRKELHFNVVEASSSEKASVLAGIIRSDLPAKYRTTAGSFYQTRDSDTNCGIVFCPHTNGDYGVVKVADDIKARINIQTQCYSGKPPTGIGEDQWRGIKNKNAKGFKDNEFPLLVATNAFGMGIDKANIRFTVHYGMPASPEAFYQEAGRAGRDRKTSYCYLIISNDVPQRNSRLLDFSTPIEAIKNETDKTSFKDKDDIDRMMYFHLLAFGGTEEERRFADIVRRELDEVPRERKTTFNYGAMGKDAKGQLEKALHRFIILGIVRDYTVDYSAREVVAEFTTADNQAILHRYAEYVRGYNRGRVARETDKLKTWVDLPYREFATHAFAILLDFIYDTIERGRRRAMAEMLSISTQALQSKDKDGTVRARVLHYFETHHSAEIEEILTSPDAGFDLVQSIMIGAENEEGELLGGIRSPKDAAELRGEVSRSLESTPDHPGLLLLRALTESLCNDADPMIVNQNLRSAYSSALDRYGVSEDRMESLLVFTANILFDKRPDLYGPVINGILSMMRSNSYRSRLILEADFEEMLPEPMEHVMDDCVHQVMQIMKFKEE